MALIKKNSQWDKIIFATPVFTLIIFGYVLSVIVANVLFVERIGSQFLPYAYVAGAIVLFLFTLAMTSLVNRMNIATVFVRASIVGALLFTGIFLWMKTGMANAIICFYIVGHAFYIVLASTVIWNLGLKICTPFEAKRVFGYFSAGASLGGVLAGLTSSLFSKSLGTENLILFIVVSLVLNVCAVVILQRRYKDLLAEPNPSNEKTEHISWKRSLVEGMNAFKNLKIARFLMAALTLFYMVAWVSDFEFQKILGDSFPESEFARVSGSVSLVQNVALILLLIFVQQRVLQRAGVFHTLLATPIFLAIPYLFLLREQSAAAAIAVLFTTNVINYSFFSNALRLTYTAIPERVRPSVTTFIGGTADAIAMFCAGCGLIFVTSFFENIVVIQTGLIFIIGMACTLFFSQREYILQVLRNLQSTHPRDMHNAIENLAERAYHRVGVQELMKLVQWRNLDDETLRKIIFALGKIDNVKVIPSLMEIFEKNNIAVKYAIVEAVQGFSHLKKRLADFPFTRSTVVDTYEKALLAEKDVEFQAFVFEHLRNFEGDDVIRFLKKALEDKNGKTQYYAIMALRFFHDRGIIFYVKPFLDHSSLMIRAASIAALWQFSEMRPVLMKRFIEIMMRDEKESKLAMFLVISKLKFIWERSSVRAYLNDKDPEIRVNAALSLLEIGDKKGRDLIVEHLIQKTAWSSVVAQKLKYFSPKILDGVMKTIQARGELAVEICIEILRETRLNFTDQIESLISDDARNSVVGSHRF